MSGKIENLHTAIYNLVNGVTTFNQGFYERPKEITDEKLPAFAVIFEGYENDFMTSNSNKRTYNFGIEIIYDKETIDTTQTVTSDLVSSVVDVLEDNDNYSLSGNCNYTLPTKCTRIEDYVIAGKHYLAYKITLQAIFNSSL